MSPNPNASDDDQQPSLTPPIITVLSTSSFLPPSSSTSTPSSSPDHAHTPSSSSIGDKGRPSTSRRRGLTYHHHQHHNHKSISPGKRSDGSEGTSTTTASTSTASRAPEEEAGAHANPPTLQSLSWDITYSIPEKKGRAGGCCSAMFPCAAAAAAARAGVGKKASRRVLLESIVGQAEAGDLVAVMGASGCGKSTFLNCLALRDQSFEGQVLLNDAPVKKQYLSLVGFVDQHDLFYPTQTVREHLEFHAMVRLGAEVSRQTKLARVQEVLIELNLSHVADSYIGGGRSTVRGLSGGERRRLSFATEMLSNPMVVIADEATTGLDASMAKSVSRFLRNMADSGRLVIASIHQPSSQTFNTFTHLLLLAGSGHTAFYGPMATFLPYLASIGLQCPPYHNVADFAVRCVAIPPGDEAAPAAARVVRMCAVYEASDLARSNHAWKAKGDSGAPSSGVGSGGGREGGTGMGFVRVSSQSMQQLASQAAAAANLWATAKDREDEEREEERGSHGKVYARDYNASWSTQFLNSVVRQLQALQRDRKMTIARCFVGVGTGLVIGLAFRGPKGQEFAQSGITDTLGLMLTSAIFLLITNFFQVAFTLPGELQVFFRERMAGVNRVSTYYVGHVVQNFVFLFFWSLAFCFATFPLALPGLGWVKWATIFGIVCLSNAASTALGYVVAVATRNEAVALALVPTVSLPMALFAGFLVELRTVPVFLRWLQHLSIVKYTLHALILVTFEGQDIRCPVSASGEEGGGERRGEGFPGGGRCIYPSLESVLQRVSAGEHTLRENLVILGGLGAGLLVLGYLILARHAVTVKVR